MEGMYSIFAVLVYAICTRECSSRVMCIFVDMVGFNRDQVVLKHISLNQHKNRLNGRGAFDISEQLSLNLSVLASRGTEDSPSGNVRHR